ncbi:hypothetical protein PsYK624_027300 [Phanerochaete sordida]|uniref:Uncharacterized protein n=1 Tax=Phanerochaete sordida TaxID=48140 RepID=A0A9P3L9L2_9APHY|nr:hypothetical protein PsYK624_027300 [Phanerochaete sordida]
MVIVHRPDTAVLTLLVGASAARSRAEATSSLLSSSPVSLRAASRTLADRLRSRHVPHRARSVDPQPRLLRASARGLAGCPLSSAFATAPPRLVDLR